MEQVNVTPRNTVEEIIAGIWAEIVGIKQIGVHENFFDLGGHSLLAMQVISRLRDTFQIELPLRTLFEKPTIEGLAVAIIEKQAEGVAAEQVSGILAEMELQSEEEIERQLKYEGKTGA